MTKENFSEEYNKSKNASMILFASGDQQSRDSMHCLLEQAGYKVTACVNGAEAVGLACRQRFDVILMNIELPVIDGREAARIIRSCGNNQNTSIVAVVEAQEADEEIELLKSSFNDYIDRPIEQKALIKVIDKCIRETRQLRAGQKSSEIVCKIAADDNYPKMIEKMVCELPQWVEKMREAFDRNDLQELEFQTQTLKEQADSAGLEDWARKVTDIEQVLYTEEIEKINKKLDELVQMCVKTKLNRQTDGS